MGGVDLTPPDKAVGFRQIGQSFRDKHADARKREHSNWRNEVKLLVDASDLALSVLVSVQRRSTLMSRLDITESDLNRSTVLTEFAKSVLAFELCLSEGFYGAAATLLRREMEATNVLLSMRKGDQKNRLNPRLKSQPWLESIYKSLSGVAHNTDQEAMAFLGRGFPPTVDPYLDIGYLRHLLGYHVNCVIVASMEMAEMVPYSVERWLSPDEVEITEMVLGILVSEKIINLES